MTQIELVCPDCGMSYNAKAGNRHAEKLIFEMAKQFMALHPGPACLAGPNRP